MDSNSYQYINICGNHHWRSSPIEVFSERDTPSTPFPTPTSPGIETPSTTGCVKSERERCYSVIDTRSDGNGSIRPGVAGYELTKPVFTTEKYLLKNSIAVSTTGLEPVTEYQSHAHLTEYHSPRQSRLSRACLTSWREHRIVSASVECFK